MAFIDPKLAPFPRHRTLSPRCGRPARSTGSTARRLRTPRRLHVGGPSVAELDGHLRELHVLEVPAPSGVDVGPHDDAPVRDLRPPTRLRGARGLDLALGVEADAKVSPATSKVTTAESDAPMESPHAARPRASRTKERGAGSTRGPLTPIFARRPAHAKRHGFVARGGYERGHVTPYPRDRRIFLTEAAAALLGVTSVIVSSCSTPAPTTPQAPEDREGTIALNHGHVAGVTADRLAAGLGVHARDPGHVDPRPCPRADRGRRRAHPARRRRRPCCPPPGGRTSTTTA